mmetsp:Transcript_33476/g.71356  ORF Transcript_33476/g.71356 Transcript_33476/m.71356 type:complete len:82 (-) Transcript_33476:93-338(-)
MGAELSDSATDRELMGRRSTIHIEVKTTSGGRPTPSARQSPFSSIYQNQCVMTKFFVAKRKTKGRDQGRLHPGLVKKKRSK